MNYSLILFLVTVVTGVMWVLDKYHFAPKRRERAQAEAEEFERANSEAVQRGEPGVIAARAAIYNQRITPPWWIEYTAGLFWVIFAVFFIRSFMFEPFRIPSGSMLPTLQIGDFILVNKYEYGLRLPVIGTKVLPIGTPERGDVVVFRYPMDTNVDYIKRVIGLPGDKVAYIDKKIYVNDKELPQSLVGDWVDSSTMVTLTKKMETVGSVTHMMAVDDRVGPGLRGAPYERVGNGCRYYSNGFVCQVPEGNYFMMGDNRDNSEDSRYWGFVPDEYLVGRAFFIWANFGEMSRIGSFE